jgi:hypothetical protein
MEADMLAGMAAEHKWLKPYKEGFASFSPAGNGDGAPSHPRRDGETVPLSRLVEGWFVSGGGTGRRDA